ncbi:AtzE family amidohydrolase [Rhabdaerophilum sp. SD176]|uniref:AtzE family amidohydrolase n=1 Tax=Rhabdaerophilum sp. SD176 TaxID=2983548 RepID=UPI0024DF5DA2|nr:AtzE family amidohydrolase [Rhabdaerophilum sp. SD176]
MTDWTHESGARIAAAVQAGDVTARSVVERHLDVIEARNPLLKAFTDVTAGRALANAERIDARRRRGEALPPLAGMPFAVKNLFDIAGLPTRAGSKINRDRPSSESDATAISRLEAAGAILIGGVNMGEYAYDFTGRNAHDGHSRNPHDPERMTGGSSGGSGGCVAAGMVPVALGSDTNGSIRVPASLCGLFGLKPTYGALSRGGSFPFVTSLDHVGPLARSVEDLARVHDAMRGRDPRDPACWGGPVEPLAPQIETGIGGLRIARAGGYFTRLASPQALEAVETVAGALGAFQVAEIPEAERARAAAFVMTMTEGAALHQERLRQRIADFDPEVRDRLLAGAMLPGAWYHRAQVFRAWYKEAVAELFRQVDVLIAPATPVSAPLVDQRVFTVDGQDLPVRANLGIFTQPISFIGLPVAAVPVWPAEGMPIGVQVIAAAGRDDVVLRVARHLERAGVCTSRVAG